MISASTASQRWLLPLLLLLAGLHATTSALVRPLYQVSDEVNYVASAQRAALATETDHVLATCVSLAHGQPPAVFGGKALFNRVAGGALQLACRSGAGDAALVVARLLFSLSLVAVTWCGWQAARLLAGNALVSALTGLTLATQPVLAKYAGAISPDSLANAAAAGAVLLTLRWLVLGASTLRFVGIVALSGLAAGLKDTALALVPVHGVVLAASVAWAVVQRGSRRRALRVVLCLAALAVVPALVVLTRTPQPVDSGVARAFDAPVSFAAAVAADTLSRLPVFLNSAYTSMGGFGGTSATLPTTAAAVAAASWTVAIAGLWLAWRQGRTLPVAVLAYLALLGAACLVQAPARQVLLAMNDQHQGRWLFPVAVPAALALGAGLARIGGARSWPLVAVAQLTIMLSALFSVVQFHVTSPAWGLDRANLYLHSTGGLDIGVARTTDQVTRAWAATAPPGPAIMALISCLICGALLLRCRPVPGPTHVHHADHR